MSIALMTFDVFGTLVDWRRGLGLSDEVFDRVIDRQGELEAVGFARRRAEAEGRSMGDREAFRPYAEIVAQSLVDEAGFSAEEAARVGMEAGRWPLYPDSAEALRKLRAIARCAAITNSDEAHGVQVQAQLGFRLDGWICAEDVGTYKPDPQMWRAASRRLGVPLNRDWWHVSAYADYDHQTARALGLTCVFVKRPHSRTGPADIVVEDLLQLVQICGATGPISPGGPT
jgi:2-haloalkanoic acid dehalogenase type II